MKVKLQPEAQLESDYPLSAFLVSNARENHPLFVKYVQSDDPYDITNQEQARQLVIAATIKYIEEHEL